jgi:hypothetical protein
MSRGEDIASMEEFTNAYKAPTAKTDGRRSLERHNHEWKPNCIKTGRELDFTCSRQGPVAGSSEHSPNIRIP